MTSYGLGSDTQQMAHVFLMRGPMCSSVLWDWVGEPLRTLRGVVARLPPCCSSTFSANSQDDRTYKQATIAVRGVSVGEAGYMLRSRQYTLIRE